MPVSRTDSCEVGEEKYDANTQKLISIKGFSVVFNLCKLRFFSSCCEIYSKVYNIALIS